MGESIEEMHCYDAAGHEIKPDIQNAQPWNSLEGKKFNIVEEIPFNGGPYYFKDGYLYNGLNMKCPDGWITKILRGDYRIREVKG